MDFEEMLGDCGEDKETQKCEFQVRTTFELEVVNKTNFI